MRPVTSRNTESASASSVVRMPLGQQPGDVPQQLGLLVEHLQHAVVRDRQHGASARGPAPSPSAAARRACPSRRTGRRLHQRDDALAPVDRVGDGDRQPTAQHEIQRVRRVALVEEHVAADQVVLGPAGGHDASAFGIGVGEEVGAGEGLFVSHDIGHGTTLRRCAQVRSSCGPSWWPVARANGSELRSSTRCSATFG